MLDSSSSGDRTAEAYGAPRAGAVQPVRPRWTTPAALVPIARSAAGKLVGEGNVVAPDLNMASEDFALLCAARARVLYFLVPARPAGKTTLSPSAFCRAPGYARCTRALLAQSVCRAGVQEWTMQGLCPCTPPKGRNALWKPKSSKHCVFLTGIFCIVKGYPKSRFWDNLSFIFDKSIGLEHSYPRGRGKSDSAPPAEGKALCKTSEVGIVRKHYADETRP